MFFFISDGEGTFIHLMNILFQFWKLKLKTWIHIILTWQQMVTQTRRLSHADSYLSRPGYTYIVRCMDHKPLLVSKYYRVGTVRTCLLIITVGKDWFSAIQHNKQNHVVCHGPRQLWPASTCRKSRSEARSVFWTKQALNLNRNFVFEKCTTSTLQTLWSPNIVRLKCQRDLQHAN